MLTDLLLRLQQNKLLVRLLMISAVVIAVGGVAYYILTSASYTRQTVYSTPYNTTSGFSTLIGSDIYSYNGGTFYKKNVKSGVITVLQAGIKLPVPSSVHWAGDNGALMTFSQSYILTEVERVVQSTGQEMDERNELYTWYLDFKTSTLHMVSTMPVASQRAVYSQKDNGFYFIPNRNAIGLDEVDLNDSDEELTSLLFYNVQTKSVSTVAQNLDLTDVSYLGVCSSMKVCIIARDISNTSVVKLYGIDTNNAKKLLLESTVRLIATNSPKLFLTTSNTVSKATTDTGNEPETDFSQSPVSLYDIETKKTSKLDFKLANETVVAHFTSDKDFYIISDNSGNEGTPVASYYAGGMTLLGNRKTKEMPVVDTDNTPYEKGLIDIASHGDNGISLITSATGEQMLFVPRGSIKALTPISAVKAETIVKNCVATSADSYEYFSETTLFKTYFVDNTDFRNNIKKFSDCVAKEDPNVLVGYNYYFGSLDPFNGRITSD